MERYMFASHGSLAHGFCSALEMIAGTGEPVTCYDLDEYQTPQELYAAAEQQVRENPGDTFVVFTDLMGGSVHNQLLCLCRYENVVVISGAHLGLILEMILNKSGGTAIWRARRAVESTLPMIRAFSRETIAEEREKENEEGGLFL